VPFLVAALTYVFAAPLSPPLSLQLVALKAQIIVGEPVMVDVLWSSSEQVYISRPRLKILLNDGSGFTRWSETPQVYALDLDAFQRLLPGRTISTSHLLGATGPFAGVYRLAFPRAGQYRVVAKYDTDGIDTTSNEITITVVPPEGEDAALFAEHVAPSPILLSAHSRLLGDSRLEALFEEYGASVYLARPRLLYLERKLQEAVREAPEPIPPSGPVGGDVPALLARLAAADLGTSVFDVERLLLLARTQDRTGRPADAVQSWTRILERYPNGAAAEQARRRLRLPPLSH
jgi:hypothetical protein